MQVAYSAFQHTAPHLLPGFGKCTPSSLPSPINTKLSSPNGYRTRRTTSPYLQSRITKDGVIKKKYVYPKKMCTVPGCNTPRKSKGLCKKHGGAKQCDIPGCTKNAKSGGKCIHHGGGLCVVEGCKSGARKNRMCYIHNQERIQKGLVSHMEKDEDRMKEEDEDQSSQHQDETEGTASIGGLSSEEEEIVATFDIEAFEPLPFTPGTSEIYLSPYLLSAEELQALLQSIPDNGDEHLSSSTIKIEVEKKKTLTSAAPAALKEKRLFCSNKCSNVSGQQQTANNKEDDLLIKSEPAVMLLL